MTKDIPGIFAFSRALSASASISVRMARSSGSFLSRGAATRCAMTVELGQRQLSATTSDNSTARILDIFFKVFSLPDGLFPITTKQDTTRVTFDINRRPARPDARIVIGVACFVKFHIRQFT